MAAQKTKTQKQPARTKKPAKTKTTQEKILDVLTSLEEAFNKLDVQEAKNLDKLENAFREYTYSAAERTLGFDEKLYLAKQEIEYLLAKKE